MTRTIFLCIKVGIFIKMKTTARFAVMLILLLGNSSFIEQGRWLIAPQSRLSILGTTNVNTFKCMLDSYTVNDTLEYSQGKKSIEMKITKNKMRIPVRSFNCGHKQITKDFLETLKSKEYPQLEISFRSFTNRSITDKSTVNGIVDITLAGTTKRFTVTYFARIPSTGVLLLTGKQAVNFSDFRLKPPSKMMGMIQVQESLEVEFNLMLKTI